MWAGGVGRYRRRSGVRWSIGTEGAASPDADAGTPTPITSGIGPTAGRRGWITWFSCAADIIGRCTRRGSVWSSAVVGEESLERMVEWRMKLGVKRSAGAGEERQAAEWAGGPATERTRERAKERAGAGATARAEGLAGGWVGRWRSGFTGRTGCCFRRRRHPRRCPTTRSGRWCGPMPDGGSSRMSGRRRPAGGARRWTSTSPWTCYGIPRLRQVEGEEKEAPKGNGKGRGHRGLAA